LDEKAKQLGFLGNVSLPENWYQKNMQVYKTILATSSKFKKLKGYVAIPNFEIQIYNTVK
jgi:hypothetical protein